MLNLQPSILERDGKKAFAILTYEEFLKVQEELEAYEDLKELRAAKAEDSDAPGIPLDEARRQLARE